ncbi:MAG: hypothetical protein HOP28_12695 [Gemmatimonadales bacterium]|nr:hypothetical protein [Gemmatimonadales bacterium]
MSGCLTLPFRIAALLIVVLLGYVAWSYRREIRRQVHEWTAESAPPAPRGRAVEGGARAVLQRLDSLALGRRDSILIGAAEVATLFTSLAGTLVPGGVDSVEVILDADDIEVRAQVDPSRIPVSLGPVSGVLRDREVVEAGGRLVFRRAGLAEWQVERGRVRGVPLPKEIIDRVLRRFSAAATAGVIPFAIPQTISGLRVTPAGLILYGSGRGGPR